MTIDWTQTLIGSSRNGEAGLGVPDAAPFVRLIGAGVACAGIGVALAVSPLRGSATSMADIVCLAGLMLANVLGYLAEARFGARGRAFGILAAGIVALFASLAGLGASVVAAIAAITLAEASASLTRSRRLAIGAGFLAVTGAFAALAIKPGAALPIVASLVPVMLILSRHLLRAEPANEQSTGAEGTRLRALLAAARHETRREVHVTDIVGRIDHAAGEGPVQAAQRDWNEDASLVEATLIADRVILLDALSRAIRGGASSRGLVLRVRREPAGAGYPSPPRFETVRIAVAPMPGIDDRAIVTVEPVAMSDDGAEASPLDMRGIEQALHESVGPFNAGMGFLDMIADPLLAPRDIATYREFAAEAHTAIADAHRNSVLVGRLLLIARLGYQRAKIRVQPARLLADAVRAMHLRKAVETGAIRLACADDLPAIDVDPLIGRLALEAMLHYANGAERARIAISAEGSDLVVICHREGEADHATAPDALLAEIERVLAMDGMIAFEADDDAGRRLRLRGAVARPLAGAQGAAPGLRLAS